jgi:hypothetical protein
MAAPIAIISVVGAVLLDSRFVRCAFHRMIARTALVGCLLLAACGRASEENALPADRTAAGGSAAVSARPLPPGDSGARKLLPVDQADRSFAAFRDSLLTALQRRDTTFLYAILAPEIKNSFGGDDSIAGFRRIWNMENPGSSQVWDALTRVLKLGGHMQGETFIAPYVFSAWPNDVDAFEHVAVTAANVPAYASPDPNAERVATLSHSILRLEQFPEPGDGVPSSRSFARVRLPDGRSVWVSTAHLYSPVGWRAFFEKRAGRWVMTLFVAGD